MTKNDDSLKHIRRMKKKSAKVREETKQTLLIRGNKVSNEVMTFLRNMYLLRKDKSVLFSQKHEIHPFETQAEIQKMCKKKDASFFVFGSHNKKRPHNIVLGRTYEHKILDMVELGIQNFKSIEDFGAESKILLNSQPFLIFQGDLWETNEEFKKIRNLFNDYFFSNHKMKGVEINQVMNVLVTISALENQRIMMQIYQVKIEGSDILDSDGDIQLENTGPEVLFSVRRKQFADSDMWTKATHVPKPKKKKANKNIKYDQLGTKRGKLYVDRQDLAKFPQKRKFIQRKSANGKGANGNVKTAQFKQ